MEFDKEQTVYDEKVAKASLEDKGLAAHAVQEEMKVNESAFNLDTHKINPDKGTAAYSDGVGAINVQESLEVGQTAASSQEVYLPFTFFTILLWDRVCITLPY